MINYYDNFLESHIAQLIDMQMREVSWKYDYDSKPNVCAFRYTRSNSTFTTFLIFSHIGTMNSYPF